MVNQQLHQIDPNLLQPNPLQPRGVINPESITDLVDSVSEHGVLEPLVVAHTPAGYQIIAGERRWRAARMAGVKTVPCIVKEVSPQKMLELAIVENVQREDLNPLERAKAFERLMSDFQLTYIEVAKKIGKSPSYVSNTLRLLSLPDTLKDGLLTGMITEGHARALYGIKDKAVMVQAYRQILTESASVRRAEEIARRIKANLEKQNKMVNIKKSTTRLDTSEYIDKIKKKIQTSLGKKSMVKLARSSRQTKILLVLKGNIKETDPILKKIVTRITK